MIITCPACRTRFRIAPSSLGEAGRNVRCSSCGERWFVESFTDAAPLPPLPAESAIPADGATAGAGRASRLVPWLAAGLVALLVTAALVGRNQIAARLPGTAPVYQRLGLSLELPLGMEFRELSSERRAGAGSGPVLVVSGQISNISGQRRELPPIRVALLDADRRELEHGLFDPPQPALPRGGVARFEVELGAPPPGASDFSVSFDLGH